MVDLVAVQRNVAACCICIFIEFVVVVVMYYQLTCLVYEVPMICRFI